MRLQPNLPLPKTSPPVPPDLLAIVRGILSKFGPKQGVVAKQLKTHEGQFSDALNGKPGRHFAAEWLDFIAAQYDFENEIASFFAAKRGLRVSEPKPMTAEEWRRRVTHVLNQHNGLGQALLAEAMALPEDEFGDGAVLP